MRGRANHWKYLFFVLLGVNAFIIGGMVVLLFPYSSPAEDDPLSQSDGKGETIEYFTLTTTPDRLNTWMATEWEQENYRISLQKEGVVFKAYFSLMGKTVPFHLTFTPTVSDEGNLQLRKNRFQVGSFPLPGEKTLQVIKEQATLPEWVDVRPNEESVYINTTQHEFIHGFYVKIEQFNLENGNIVFTLFR